MLPEQLIPNAKIFYINGSRYIPATVVKVNRTTVLVSDDVGGKKWRVPFPLCVELDPSGNPIQPPAPKKEPLTDFWIMDNQNELTILSGIYNQLSPENLCCDGEISRTQVNIKRRILDKKLQACFTLMDREVDETECYDALERMEKLIAEGKTTALATLQ